VVYGEPKADLALLLIQRSGKYQPVKFADSDHVELGEQVVVIGNPLGYAFTVTVGIVSGLDREITMATGSVLKKVIQTDASINPGNSGGPVLNIDGELIGIASAIHRGAENIAFVIPANRVREMWKAASR
jgi:S1-C subfamily serine protease